MGDIQDPDYCNRHVDLGVAQLMDLFNLMRSSKHCFCSNEFSSGHMWTCEVLEKVSVEAAKNKESSGKEMRLVIPQDCLGRENNES